MGDILSINKCQRNSRLSLFVPLSSRIRNESSGAVGSIPRSTQWRNRTIDFEPNALEKGATPHGRNPLF